MATNAASFGGRTAVRPYCGVLSIHVTTNAASIGADAVPLLWRFPHGDKGFTRGSRGNRLGLKQEITFQKGSEIASTEHEKKFIGAKWLVQTIYGNVEKIQLILANLVLTN